MMGFRSNFRNSSGSPRVACMAVLSCILMSWSSGNLLGMILDRFGIIHFFIIFIIIFTIFWSIVDAAVLWRYLSVFNDSFKYHHYDHKEKISEAHVFFEWIAPPKSPTYMSKIIKKYALAHGSICLD